MVLTTAKTWVDEITDFLLARPTLEEIINFQASDALDDRLHHLLDKNSSTEGLAAEERKELDSYLLVNHLFTILKAKALIKLEGED